MCYHQSKKSPEGGSFPAYSITTPSPCHQSSTYCGNCCVFNAYHIKWRKGGGPHATDSQILSAVQISRIMATIMITIITIKSLARGKSLMLPPKNVIQAPRRRSIALMAVDTHAHEPRIKHEPKDFKMNSQLI